MRIPEMVCRSSIVLCVLAVVSGCGDGHDCESGSFWSAADAAHEPLTVCTAQEYEARPPTATRDRMCVPRNAQVSAGSTHTCVESALGPGQVAVFPDDPVSRPPLDHVKLTDEASGQAYVASHPATQEAARLRAKGKNEYFTMRRFPPQYRTRAQAERDLYLHYVAT